MTRARGRSDRGPSCIAPASIPTIEVFRTCWEYTWIDPGGERHPLEGVEWAERDPRGRLAVARAGKILVAEPSDGAPEFRELIDLDPHEFTPLEAPGWARSW